MKTILTLGCVLLLTFSGCSGTPTKESVVKRIKNATGDTKWDALNDHTMACYTSVENLIQAVGKPDSRVNAQYTGDEIWTWRCSDGAVDAPVHGVDSKQVALLKGCNRRSAGSHVILL